MRRYSFFVKLPDTNSNILLEFTPTTINPRSYVIIVLEEQKAFSNLKHMNKQGSLSSIISQETEYSPIASITGIH